ncbi:MAG: hypothetical protein INR73_00395 [Williamsia sp.]|nr:hypothetical protein [Williamsia sp.]
MMQASKKDLSFIPGGTALPLTYLSRCTQIGFNSYNTKTDFMDDRPNDETERRVETVQYRTQHPIPPSSRVVTPFKSIQEWLQFLCEHEHHSEPVSEYMIAFSEPPRVLAYLVGRNHGIEQGVPVTRIVFQPKQYMWFKLPTKKYGGLTRQQLVEKIHSELKEFFTTEQFKKSFLARGYNISTNFQEDIWSL